MGQWGGSRGNPGPTVVLANTTYSNQGRQAHAALSVKLFRTQKVLCWSYIDLAAPVVRRRLPGWHSTTHLVGSDFSASVTGLSTSDTPPVSTNPVCFSRPIQPLLQPRLLREDVAPSGYSEDCPCQSRKLRKKVKVPTMPNSAPGRATDPWPLARCSPKHPIELCRVGVPGRQCAGLRRQSYVTVYLRKAVVL